MAATFDDDVEGADGKGVIDLYGVDLVGFREGAVAPSQRLTPHCKPRLGARPSWLPSDAIRSLVGLLYSWRRT